ncbi:MAG: orotidine-5'-phosphate decarboxylase, partial [Planctomycetaceae bacterium]|nr:orotidine-5'-phosphate decarboxylase [Planctomycetaceae bacterium]
VMGAPVCVGIDPHLDRIPLTILEKARKSYTNQRDIIVETVCGFCMPLLDVLIESGIRVVKPQVAFFEALGPNGLAAYEIVCQQAQELGMLVIADVKRGDIGSTSAAYAAAWLGGTHIHGLRLRPFAVDAVTINPYFGTDGVDPFVKAAAETSRGVFILLKTSNKTSAEFQDLVLAGGEPVYTEVARKIEAWGSASTGERGYSDIGAVVGANTPEIGAILRDILPNTLFLVPGFGAQGAGPDEIRPLFKADGTGAIVNSSRGVIHAYGNDTYTGDWKALVASAAKQFIADVRGALGRPAKAIR